MTNIYIQFFKKYSEYKSQHLRSGQAVFNALSNVDRALADKIRNTEFDCYYNDKNIGVVLSLLVDKYKDELLWTI